MPVHAVLLPFGKIPAGAHGVDNLRHSFDRSPKHQCHPPLVVLGTRRAFTSIYTFTVNNRITKDSIIIYYAHGTIAICTFFAG